jgi:ABC-type molybdenum transport system ATPase subunit/photorepair protein PhrA
VHVGPMKTRLKAPGSKRLKLQHAGLLSNFAFNLNLPRYTKALVGGPSLCFLDEPTSGLSTADAAQVVALLGRACQIRVHSMNDFPY